jgi:hypothetical protein
LRSRLCSSTAVPSSRPTIYMTGRHRSRRSRTTCSQRHVKGMAVNTQPAGVDYVAVLHDSKLQPGLTVLVQ